MKFLVSSNDTGVVKEVIFNRGTDTSKQDATQPKSIKNFCSEPDATRKNRIVHMLDYESKFLVAVRLGGEVSVYEINDDEYEVEDEYKYNLLHNYKLEGINEDMPVSLLAVEELEGVIVAYQSGKIVIISFKEDKFDRAPVVVQLPGNKTISDFTANPSEAGVFAYGGEENDVRVIRLFEKDFLADSFDSKVTDKHFKPQVLFTAKNVKNDHLDLRVPVWITQLRFFTEQPESGYKFITATKYGQIRIYDTNHGRRPVKDYTVCERPILRMTFADEDETEVIISDSHNLIAKHSLVKVDEKALKTNSASAGTIIKPVAKLLGKFVDQFGATYGIRVGEGLLVTGGLDRYLRVFDLDTREVIAKAYLGVEIADLIVLEYEDEEEEEEVVDEELLKLQQRRRRRELRDAEEESDEEELWNQLDESEESKSKDVKRKKLH
ncbi:ribosome biogenesis protein NSA1 [Scheffersomyces xylosifermentans]|uniref:ribosome biogenesis protein NSA1 n=1 Tax=Scheffersomyces xylosifermentans TaxID=1304137 RepID=UPI00315D21A6